MLHSEDYAVIDNSRANNSSLPIEVVSGLASFKFRPNFVKKLAQKNKERFSLPSPLEVGFDSLNIKAQVTTSPPKPIILKSAPPHLPVPVVDENDDSCVPTYLSQFLLHTFEVG
ncbi:hypothetical protein Q3G72_010309 [Acer saccharum]|nr:hypothetical protein Q3G72_010309 [Acer saccharum]